MRYRVGDWVVYRKSKYGAHPGPRAQDVRPASKGDRYSYIVDKFWVVEKILEDGQVLVRTRRGKRHQIASSDPDLRPANWFQRLLYRRRFVPNES
jgi:hypothetical protein